MRAAIQPESTGLELAGGSRGVTTPVPCVYLPVSLTAPGPSGSTGPARLCRGCSRPHRRPPAQTSSSFTPPLRRQRNGGLAPPSETSAPRGALRLPPASPRRCDGEEMDGLSPPSGTTAPRGAHEQAVQALQGHRAVHMEEIGGEHCRGLRAQELPPRRVGVPLRCRGDLQYLEDPADRRRADPVAELEQFALDPLVSPAAVPGGEPPGQRGDLCAGWRSSCAARIGPLPGDQAAVPPKDGSRGDQAVCSQLPWQVPDQRGHDGSAGPVEAGSGPGAAQRGDLVPQYQQ